MERRGGEAGIQKGVEGWRGKTSNARKSSLSYSSFVFFTVSSDTVVDAVLEVVLNIEGCGVTGKLLSHLFFSILAVKEEEKKALMTTLAQQ